jgi:hypothetical protein
MAEKPRWDLLLAQEKALESFLRSPAGQALIEFLEERATGLQQEVVEGDRESFDLLKGRWSGVVEVLEALLDARSGFKRAKRDTRFVIRPKTDLAAPPKTEFLSPSFRGRRGPNV